MKKPSKKGMKTLTPKDRVDLADQVRACIMTAEATASTQVALDRLADIQVAENGFWDDQRCVAVDGHFFAVEGPEPDGDDEDGEVTDDVLEVLYEELRALVGVEVRVTTGMPYVEETRTIGPIVPPKKRVKKTPPATPDQSEVRNLFAEGVDEYGRVGACLGRPPHP